MKTQLLTFLCLAVLHTLEAARPQKSKRGSLGVGLIDLTGSQSGWKGSNVPIQGSGVNNFLPLHVVGDYNLNVDFPAPPPPRPGVAIISNSLEKPVMESQEIIPPQSVGTAIIPRVPPLATPVNAVASNVPASGGAVYLGSGSIGVVDLGNGAYALGSGSIGYSGNRSRPRPNAMVPVYPPIPASPNLIPAAVPSPAPMPPGTVFQIPNNLDFNHPFFNVPQVPQVDQNGYEYLPPNRVGFGTPTPRPPTVKTRMQFATPTALQLQPQIPQGLPPVNYDFDISLGHPSGGGLSTLG